MKGKLKGLCRSNFQGNTWKLRSHVNKGSPKTLCYGKIAGIGQFSESSRKLFCKEVWDSQSKIYIIIRDAVTVVCISESKWPDLWSKWPISDMVFYKIKMPPCSGPLGSTLVLIGALKWGTVWTSTSTGTGIMKGQSKNFEIYLIESKCST